MVWRRRAGGAGPCPAAGSAPAGIPAGIPAPVSTPLSTKRGLSSPDPGQVIPIRAADIPRNRQLPTACQQGATAGRKNGQGGSGLHAGLEAPRGRAGGLRPGSAASGRCSSPVGGASRGCSSTRRVAAATPAAGACAPGGDRSHAPGTLPPGPAAGLRRPSGGRTQPPSGRSDRRLAPALWQGPAPARCGPAALARRVRCPRRPAPRRTPRFPRRGRIGT